MNLLSIDIGTRNLAICGIQWDLRALVTREWSAITVIQWDHIDMDVELDLGKKKPLLRQYIDYLVVKIKDVVDKYQYHAIVIENQMRSRFQVIAHSIYAIARARYPDIIVGFCSSQLKLQCSIDTFSSEKVNRYGRTHNHRKKIANGITDMILPKINVSTELINKFNTIGKKDDLSDAFLQAIRLLQQI